NVEVMKGLPGYTIANLIAWSGAGIGGSGESAPTLFRGTSVGWAGSQALQRLAMTPATLDPAIATIFATESSNFGTSAMHIALPQALKGAQVVEGNVLAGLEREVGVALTPTEFAARASKTITAEQS